MKEILERLYAEISADPATESLDTRVKGANLSLRSLSPERAVGLAVLAHRSQQHDEALDWLAERMESGGKALNRSHAQEAGILAAAILLKAWRGEPSEAASAGALAVRAGAFLGWKPRLTQLASAARSYLDRAALEVRDPGPVELGKGALQDSAEDTFPDGNPHSPERAREMHEELTGLRLELDSALRNLETASRASREQSSVLWWLFGERLIDGRGWSETSEASRPLELARDLSALTEFVPGPLGSSGFLGLAISRSGMKPGRELTVGGAIRGLTDGSALASNAPLPAAGTTLVSPLLCCLHHIEYPAQARPGALRRSAQQIAEQLYGELLLQDTVSDEGNE
jgi:GTPase-associated system helical domain